MFTQKISVRDMCLISLFTAVIAISSQIIIPMPYGVPMTLQTLAIPLAGVALGPKKGTISTVLYIFLGILGMPVFSGFASGIGVIFGATGGFILSFPFLAFTAGIGMMKENRVWLIFWLVLGILINYLFGMLLFSLITSNGLKTTFFACVFPFIPTAIIKLFVVIVISTRVKNLINNKKIF